jgi:predicted NACHT family NTPase
LIPPLKTFASKFIGTREYLNERAAAPFGSAVDPDTGAVDQKTYTSIRYIDGAGAFHTDSEITRLLKTGRKIVLVGEFGTGKSRCLMQVFKNLAAENHVFVPVAINLRDNWGYRRFSHIIHNHLDALGLGEFQNTLVRSLRRGNHVLLLDGFDEIGSQSQKKFQIF